MDGQRKKLRQQESLPVLEELGGWMKDQYREVLPKSPIGQGRLKEVLIRIAAHRSTG